MRHSPYLLHGQFAGSLLNHLGNWLPGNQRVDKIAVEPVSKLSQLSQGDAVFGLGLFGFVQTGAGNAQTLSLLALVPKQVKFVTQLAQTPRRS